MHFAISPTEYIQVALPLAMPMIGLIVAFIKRNKKLRIDYFENGQVKTIDTNRSIDEIEKALKMLGRHQDSNGN